MIALLAEAIRYLNNLHSVWVTSADDDHPSQLARVPSGASKTTSLPLLFISPSSTVHQHRQDWLYLHFNIDTLTNVHLHIDTSNIPSYLCKPFFAAVSRFIATYRVVTNF